MTAFDGFRKNIKKFDFTLFFLLISICTIGVLMVYSATRSYNSSRYFLVQLLACGLGLFSIYIITRFDYEFFGSMWGFFFGLNIILLVAVLIFGRGSEETGTQGWILLGGSGIQPAEFAKVGFIITLAHHLSKIKEDINELRNIIGLVLHLAVPVGLILMQPDAGTALVFVFIFAIMVFVAGINWRYIAGAVGAIIAASPFIYIFAFDEYQKERVLNFLNPSRDPLGAGYQVMQSKIAIGSGKIFGKGFLQGTQNQLEFLPEKHNDFIFAVVGEELGLIGAVVLAVLLLILIARVFYIGANSKSFFGMMLCVGVGAMLLFHTVENIGMSMGLLPVTGIGLPFVSYGGSSTLTFFLAIGLVFNVHLRRRLFKF